VLNNDLAPTFADLADTDPPSFVDGRSLVPLLDGDPPSEEGWRSAFLVEAAGELGVTAVPPLSGDRLPKEWWNEPRESWGRPEFEAVRTGDHLYVEYGTGERELYDLRRDPHQLHNRYDAADPALLRRLEEKLAALRDCSGTDCRAAEKRGVGGVVAAGRSLAGGYDSRTKAVTPTKTRKKKSIAARKIAPATTRALRLNLNTRAEEVARPRGVASTASVQRHRRRLVGCFRPLLPAQSPSG
jgi:hypothetical protein